MSHFFTNLPVRYIADDWEFLEYFLQKNITPELGLDAISLDQIPKSKHEQITASLQEQGLACSIHLPFNDLQPGSMDNMILKATRQRLTKAMEIAKLYQPVHLLAHAYLIPLYGDMFSMWLNRSLETWVQILEVWPECPTLFLENVREQDPGPLSDLFSELSSYKVKFCFDVGHWFSYGAGSQYQNLHEWLQTLSPYLCHLHLHDNDGIADQHLGLGQGNFPWADLFWGLEFLDLRPGFTLEPHTKEDLEHSLRFIQKNLSWFSRLNISRQEITNVLT